jgi:GalNAc5-diNAcBac-PP-undecaprenol beta-1,3-glucosyltransferase
MNPKITIIMATYNRAHFIVETLTSIQNQTFQQWECLIIDDGGTDATEEVIQPILKRDGRFQFYKRQEKYQKGLPGCRNYGLDLAKGDYIIFFDDDDIVHPQNLSISLNCLETSKKDFCHYGKSPFINVSPVLNNQDLSIKKEITINDIKDIVTQKIGFASCTVLWKISCFNGNKFNEDLHYAEEWECYIRLITNGFSGIMIDNILYYNRKHPNSNTGEYFNNNLLRKKSYAKAIILVSQNLKIKQLLSYSIKRYLISKSIGFKEYNLFSKILKILDLPIYERLQWLVFFKVLPYRLMIYRNKRLIENKYNS